MNIIDELKKLDYAKVKESFDKFIVRPAGALGFGGFVFDVDRETVITLKAQITDHYVEDNTPVQDHIALEPLRVELRGYIGELVDKVNSPSNDVINNVVKKLTVVNGYLPVLTTGANQVKNFIQNKNFSSQEITSTVSDLWSLTKNLNPNATEQQKAYLYFKAVMEQKILMSLETPFEYLTNMAVETIIARQPEESKYISEFSITLKKIRFTDIEYVPLSDKFQGRLAQQKAEENNIGKASGKSKSLLELTTGITGTAFV